MCGRYFIDDKDEQLTGHLLRFYSSAIQTTSEASSFQTSYKTFFKTSFKKAPFPSSPSDIHPGDQVPVMTPQGLAKMAWGIPTSIRDTSKMQLKKTLLINARQETALDKAIFRNHIINRPILIPASSYYEWNFEKEKVTISDPDGLPLYMAGFHQAIPEDPDYEHFAIITTKANTSLSQVHSRMPLIFPELLAKEWLFHHKAGSSSQPQGIGLTLEQNISKLLSYTPGDMQTTQEYQQLKLPWS